MRKSHPSVLLGFEKCAGDLNLNVADVGKGAEKQSLSVKTATKCWHSDS